MTIDEAEMELVKFLEDKVGNIGYMVPDKVDETKTREIELFSWDEVNLVEFGMLRDADSIREQIYGDGLLHREFTYFWNAIEYLAKEDPSLTESFEIAKEYGHTMEILNSCLLAELHAQRKYEEEFSEIFNTDAIQEKIDELNAQIEGEDE